MMIYIINEHVTYDPLSATLYSPEHHQETVMLSRVCNSILLLFVNNNNKLLERDYLLKEVWENQGVNSSSNNLNNHISILRKSLAQCGCHDVIKTITKKGLIFSAHTLEAFPRANVSKPAQVESTSTNNTIGVPFFFESEIFIHPVIKGDYRLVDIIGYHLFSRYL